MSCIFLLKKAPIENNEEPTFCCYPKKPYTFKSHDFFERKTIKKNFLLINFYEHIVNI